VKRLTLTFDNGPATGCTERILRALDERGLPATFFMIGDRLAERSARRTAQRVKDAGHAIGNHTMTHGVPLGTSGGAARVRVEIGGAHEALWGLTGDQLLFRPNGRGILGPHLLSEAAVAYLTAHRYTVVTWNAVPRDWEAPRDSWVSRAHRAIELHDWTVLVLHDVHHRTVGDLAAFLDAVAQLGVEIRSDFPTTCLPLQHGHVDTGLKNLVTPVRGSNAEDLG
jgi:peptidoglycan/xylan/chitin deacetylase (PgdA/CDA1 family)